MPEAVERLRVFQKATVRVRVRVRRLGLGLSSRRRAPRSPEPWPSNPNPNPNPNLQKATTAIHGSLLLAVLLHQEETVKASAGRRTPHDGGDATGEEGGEVERIRRSISASEGVGS